MMPSPLNKLQGIRDFIKCWLCIAAGDADCLALLIIYTDGATRADCTKLLLEVNYALLIFRRFEV